MYIISNLIYIHLNLISHDDDTTSVQMRMVITCVS